ncbi:MAG: class I SAM-dependent methyltransferase [Acidimicrobiia bacterium]
MTGDVPDPSVARVAAVLAEAGCVAPHDEARELVAVAPDPVALAALVARRVAGEPLAWVVGSIELGGVRIGVRPGVYVPRWETGALAARAAELLPPGGRAVDLCTGAGTIAVLLRHADPSATVVATEVDPLAVEVARANGVDVRQGDLDEPLPPELAGEVDVLTAVVPYVPHGALGLLAPDARDHEPALALDGGPDGCRLLTEVVRRAPRWLRPGGWLLLELGGDHAGPVGRLATEVGFVDVAVGRDDDGDDRWVEARFAGDGS